MLRFCLDCHLVWKAGVTELYGTQGLMSHPPITPWLSTDWPITHQLCTHQGARSGGWRSLWKWNGDVRIEQFWQEWHVAHFLLIAENVYPSEKLVFGVIYSRRIAVFYSPLQWWGKKAQLILIMGILMSSWMKADDVMLIFYFIMCKLSGWVEKMRRPKCRHR